MARQVRFERFRFDTETRRLWAGRQEVRLTRKAAAVMAVLVELRRALEDDAKQPHFIETRHRRGYRFVATISPVEVEAAAPAPANRTGGRCGHSRCRRDRGVAVRRHEPSC